MINLQYSNTSVADTIRDFFHQLSLSNAQQEKIASLTKRQSCNEEWNKYRKGVITATKLLPVSGKYDDLLFIKSGNETHLFSGAVFNKCTIVVGQKSPPLSLPK